MKLKLLDINEVTLETKDKLCKENISLVVDNTNITPENIKSGISILGVNGTYTGSTSGGGDEDEPSGPTPEVCNINFMPNGPMGPGTELTIYYLDANMQFQTATTEMGEGMIRCVKNSIVYVKGASLLTDLSEGLVEINYVQSTWAFYATSNGGFFWG